jgi:hypothetical protein
MTILLPNKYTILAHHTLVAHVHVHGGQQLSQYSALHLDLR